MSLLGMGRTSAPPPVPPREDPQVAQREMDARRRLANARGRNELFYGGRCFLGGPSNQADTPGTGPTGGRTLLGG